MVVVRVGDVDKSPLQWYVILITVYKVYELYG